MITIFLITETTIALYFVGVVLLAGAGLTVFVANKSSSAKKSFIPNKNLINEKKAELQEYELKPRPTKVISNERQKKFEEALNMLDLNAMSDINLKQREKFNQDAELHRLQRLEEEKNSRIKKNINKEENKIKKDIESIDKIINAR